MDFSLLLICFFPLSNRDSHLSRTPVLVSYFPFLTVAFWSWHLSKCHRGTASLLCSPKGTDTELPRALLLFLPATRDSQCNTQMGYMRQDTALDPWGRCFCFPAGWLWGCQTVPRDGEKCLVGIFPFWKDGKISSSLPVLCTAEKALMGSLSTAGYPRDTQVFADMEPDGSAITCMLSLGDA